MVRSFNIRDTNTCYCHRITAAARCDGALRSEAFVFRIFLSLFFHCICAYFPRLSSFSSLIAFEQDWNEFREISFLFLLLLFDHVGTNAKAAGTLDEE